MATLTIAQIAVGLSTASRAELLSPRILVAYREPEVAVIERSANDVRSYYNHPTDEVLAAAGAGLIWFMTTDHLSPPICGDERFGLDSARWREVTSSRVVDLGRRLGISQGCRVLDLGNGIGGPGRDVVATTGCDMYGVNLSELQLRSLRRLSARVGVAYRWVMHADMQSLPILGDTFDVVMSINALYHVPEPRLVLAEVERVLVPGGRWGLDDWFLTNATRAETANRLRHNWSTPSRGFHVFDDIVRATLEAGLIIDEIVDYTRQAGQFFTEDRFGVTFDREVAPLLVRMFPRLYHYDGYRPQHTYQAVAQLRADILLMGTLYRSGEALYRQIVASKPGGK